MILDDTHKVKPLSTTVVAVDMEKLPEVVRLLDAVTGGAQKTMRTVGAMISQ